MSELKFYLFYWLNRRVAKSNDTYAEESRTVEIGIGHFGGKTLVQLPRLTFTFKCEPMTNLGVVKPGVARVLFFT